MAKKKKTRIELEAERAAELEKLEVHERFIAERGSMVLIEEPDPDRCTYKDIYGNPVDKDGNLLPEPAPEA